MRLLVTGANGFLGRYIVRWAAARGAHVTALGLESEGLPEDVDFRPADVCDREAVAAVVGDVGPDVIVHLAALSHVGESWRQADRYFQVNVIGTGNVLAAAGGARLVFSSSAEVYGVVPEVEQPIGEQRPVAPRSPYALTKAAAEREVLAAGGVVVRSFNLLGAGQAPRFALPSFAAQLAEIAAEGREPVLRTGNLAARRDFVHVADAAEAFGLLLERGAAGSVYNLASGSARSIGELLAELVATSGVDARTEIDPERVRPVDVPLLEGDASRLRRLGWAPRRTVEAAIGEIWAEATGARGAHV